MVREGDPGGDSYCNPEDGYDCGANEVIRESVRGNREDESITDALAEGEVLSITRHQVGREFKYKVVLKHGRTKIEALFKLAAEGDVTVNGEIGSTVLSQSLGLNITPLGLLRTLKLPNGLTKTGYLQYWVPGKTLDSPSTAKKDSHRARHNLIVLFDYLTSNKDRGGAGNETFVRENWLMGKNNLLYAIDNANARFVLDSTTLLAAMVGDGEIPVDAAQRIVKASHGLMDSTDFMRGAGLDDRGKGKVRQKIRTIAARIRFSNDKRHAYVDYRSITG